MSYIGLVSTEINCSSMDFIIENLINQARAAMDEKLYIFTWSCFYRAKNSSSFNSKLKIQQKERVAKADQKEMKLGNACILQKNTMRTKFDCLF